MEELKPYGLDVIHGWEVFTSIIYITVILLVAYFFAKSQKGVEYKYFLVGLIAKIFGGLFFAIMYIYYYKGGDTFAYYHVADCMANLLYSRPDHFFQVIFEGPSYENYVVFNDYTGYPEDHIYFEGHTFFTVLFIFPFLLLGLKSYIITTVLLSTFAFIGVWKLYQFFIGYFPEVNKYIVYSTILLPSVLFWGSGMLKDTMVFTASVLLVYYFDKSIIRKNLSWKLLFLLVLNLFLVISIKPYVFFTLVLGLAVWWIFIEISKVRSYFMKFIGMIILSVIALVGSAGLYFSFEHKFGKFSIDKIFETAVVTQQDLKRDYYDGNSFDIGKFEPTFLGALSKFPQASTAGLLRPFIWEVRSASMLLSALENFAILLLILYVLWMARFNVIRIIRIIFEHPVLLFSMIYSFMFAFSIGLSTSNFGALVRFKIPFLPFFVTALIVILYRLESGKKLT